MFEAILRRTAGLEATRTPAEYLRAHPAPLPLLCLVCGENAAAWVQMPSGAWEGRGSARVWVDDGAGDWWCGRTCDRCQARAEELERQGRERVVAEYRQQRGRQRQADAGVPEGLLSAPRALGLEWQGFVRAGVWREGTPWGGASAGPRAAEAVGVQLVRHYAELGWECRFAPLVAASGRAAEEVAGWRYRDLVVLSGDGAGLPPWERETLRAGVEARLVARQPVVWCARSLDALKAAAGEGLWEDLKRAACGRLIRVEVGQ